MRLVCEENLLFEETLRMRQAASDLGATSLTLPTIGGLMGHPYFLYGTRNYVLQYVNDYNHILNNQEELYDYSFLMGNLHEDMFNLNCMLSPAGSAYAQSSRCGLLANEFFVRPNSGNKQFNGQVVSKEDLKRLPQIFQITNDEIVVIAQAKEAPHEEYRFFCHNDKMVGCKYLPESSNRIPGDIQEYANKIREKINNLNGHYHTFVLDISMTRARFYSRPSVIELNSWNSSAFYSIDPKQLLMMLGF